MQARRNPSEQVEHRGEGQCAVVEVGVEELVEEHREDGAASAHGAAAAEEGPEVDLAQAAEGEEGVMQISQDRQEGFEDADHDYKARRIWRWTDLHGDTKAAIINKDEFSRTH